VLLPNSPELTILNISFPIRDGPSGTEFVLSLKVFAVCANLSCARKTVFQLSTFNFQPSTSSKGQAQNFIPLISWHLQQFTKIISAHFCAFLDFL
jgi:hypothetical protein